MNWIKVLARTFLCPFNVVKTIERVTKKRKLKNCSKFWTAPHKYLSWLSLSYYNQNNIYPSRENVSNSHLCSFFIRRYSNPIKNFISHYMPISYRKWHWQKGCTSDCASILHPQIIKYPNKRVEKRQKCKSITEPENEKSCAVWCLFQIKKHQCNTKRHRYPERKIIHNWALYQSNSEKWNSIYNFLQEKDQELAFAVVTLTKETVEKSCTNERKQWMRNIENNLNRLPKYVLEKRKVKNK